MRLIHGSVLARVSIPQGSLLLRRHPQAREEHPTPFAAQRDLRWMLPLFVNYNHPSVNCVNWSTAAVLDRELVRLGRYEPAGARESYCWRARGLGDTIVEPIVSHWVLQPCPQPSILHTKAMVIFLPTNLSTFPA